MWIVFLNKKKIHYIAKNYLFSLRNFKFLNYFIWNALKKSPSKTGSVKVISFISF